MHMPTAIRNAHSKKTQDLLLEEVRAFQRTDHVFQIYKSRAGPLRSGLPLQSYQFARLFNTDRTPGPPKLPKEEQEEFEELQKLASSQDAIEAYNREAAGDSTKESLNNPILTKNDIGNFSPEFSKTIPEFEGNVNPKTGEVNGPKQDPLRYGDYSYNGRVTDF